MNRRSENAGERLASFTGSGRRAKEFSQFFLAVPLFFSRTPRLAFTERFIHFARFAASYPNESKQNETFSVFPVVFLSF